MFTNAMNPDMYEIIMRELFGDSTTNGQFTLIMQMELSAFKNKYAHIMPTPEFLMYSNKIFYCTKDVLKQCNITTGIDPEIFFKFCKMSLPDLETFIPATEEIILNTKDRLQMPGVRMDEVKYPFHEHLRMEYNWQNFKELLEQTNNLSPKELGERIILMPRNIPPSFEELESMFSTLFSTEEVNLEEIYSDTFEMDIDEKCEYMRKHNLCFDENYEIIREPLKINSNSLTLEKLQQYKKNYNLFINVDLNNNQLYTRGRCLINTFIQLNDSIKHSLILQLYGSENIDNFNIFLGERIGPILKNYATPRIDIDHYPVFSQLYTHGSLYDLIYPHDLTTGSVVSLQDEVIPINFSVVTYKGNDGYTYIILILDDVDYWEFIKYLINNADLYNLSNTKIGRLVFKDFCTLNDPTLADVVLIKGLFEDSNFRVSVGNKILFEDELLEQLIGKVTVNHMPWLATNDYLSNVCPPYDFD